MRTRDESKLAFARQLRRSLTAPEARLWLRLRPRDESGLAFRRQVPIDPYILDFYCAKAKLAVEVDGLIHDTYEQAVRDERRDLWLLEKNILTYRIPASEIMADPDEVAMGIWFFARERWVSLKPL